MTVSALVIVDCQLDFITGSLAVPDAASILPGIQEIEPAYDFVLASKDHHPANHMSFTQQGGPWPSHCVAGTIGNKLHPAIEDLDPRVVYKGEHPDREAYSAFDGHVFGGYMLGDWLAEHSVQTVDVCGLALDYCVRATALSASHRFKTTLLLNLSRPVDFETGAQAIVDCLDAGVHVANAR